MRSVRYWDKAGTADGGAYTVGVLMHKMTDGSFVIEHVARGQWSALEREGQIKSWARSDRKLIRGSYEIGIEQEPGSGGKESAEATIRAATYFCTPVPGSVTCWPRWRLGRTASTRTRSTLARARSTG